MLHCRVTKHEQQFKKDGITWLHVPLQKHVLAFTILGWWLLYDRRLAIDLFGEKMEEKKKKGKQTLINFLTAYGCWPKMAHMQQMLVRNFNFGLKVVQVLTYGLIKAELCLFLAALDEFTAVIPWC